MALAILELPGTRGRVFSSQDLNFSSRGLLLAWRTLRRASALLSADGLFDFVKRCDLDERLFGERRVAANGDLVEPPPQMGPAEGQDERLRWWPAAREVLVGGIAVDLQNAAEALEMAFHMLRPAARRIAIDDGGRIAAAPGPVVASISPELAALHALAARIEDGAARLVGKQFRRGFQELEQARLQGSQQRRRTADPIGERRAVEIDALAAIDLRLPIQRTVISVFRNQHVGDKVFGWDAGFDQHALAPELARPRLRRPGRHISACA